MGVDIEISAGTVDEAVEIALEELGVDRTDVEVEVLEDASKGFLGLGNRQARVRVIVRPEVLSGSSVSSAADETSETDEIASTGRYFEHPAAEGDGPAMGNIAVDPEVVSQVREFTAGIIDGIGIDGHVEANDVGGTLEVVIDGEDMGLLIGRRGDTLAAMQTLVSAFASRIAGGRVFVTLDIQGYRERKKESLEGLAQRISERVAAGRKPYKMRPMSASDRRVVHMYVKAQGRVESSSEGNEPERFVVISPKR